MADQYHDIMADEAEDFLESEARSSSEVAAGTWAYLALQHIVFPDSKTLAAHAAEFKLIAERWADLGSETQR